MGFLVVALALTVELGGIFGSASAVGTEVDESTIQVDLTVEMSAGGAVVAHLLEPGGEDRTVALDERLPGVYGGIFETRKIDLVVVFEAVGPPSVQSESVQLTELGLIEHLVKLRLAAKNYLQKLFSVCFEVRQQADLFHQMRRQ